MSFEPGTRLGPYDLQSRLGGGGMGEVWKAYDPKLQRTVAIKVLKDQDDDAATRILAEARAASALNHNHICTVHDVGEADGQSFIVMERVEGKPLSELIPSDGLPPESVIRYGTQIADALAHAHEHGIVHRDLKSANVVITPEAQVKLIDFGIAVPLSAGDAEDVTRTLAATAQSRMLVGTLGYMAPEVLQGEAATTRSDIWALGVLLYEMASGAQPFTGTTQTDVVAAVMKESPAPLPAKVSPGLRNVIEHCLIKEPARRYPHPSAIQAALDAIHSDMSVARSGVITGPSSRWGWRVATMVGTVALAAVIVYLARSNEPTRSRATVPRLGNPVQVTRATGIEDYPSWSPDGQSLVYESNDGGDWNIWVSQLGGGQPLNRTSDSELYDRHPSWSPDGSQIAFLSGRDGGANGSLYVMPVLAGPARQIVRDATPGTDLEWSPNGGELVYRRRTGLAIVSLASGESTDVTGFAGMDFAWSPDGRFVASVRGNHTNFVTQVRVVRLADGEVIPITDVQGLNWSPTWSPDSRTLYFVSDRNGERDLWQQALDAEGRPDGSAQAVTAGLGLFHAALAPDGSRLACSRGGRVANVWRVPILTDRPATWTDAQQITFDQAFIDHAEASPNGERLVINSNRGGNWDLWVQPAAGGDPQQVTTHAAPDGQPQWSPDGTMLVFDSHRSGSRDVWVIPAQGGPARRLTSHEGSDWYPSWSPDGRRIAFKSNRTGGNEFWTVPVDGGEPTQVTHDVRGANLGAVWSPDGQWLSFTGRTDHDPSEINSLWRVRATGGEASELVRPAASAMRDGSAPSGHVWSSDGRFLYFAEFLVDQRRWGDLWSSSVSTGEEQQLTDLTGRSGSVNGVGLSTDGEHLYFVWQEDSVGDIWVMDVVQDEE